MNEEALYFKITQTIGSLLMMDNAGEEKETQLCSTFKQPESLPKFSLYWI
jgi:hypothetical protein